MPTHRLLGSVQSFHQLYQSSGPICIFSTIFWDFWSSSSCQDATENQPETVHSQPFFPIFHWSLRDHPQNDYKEQPCWPSHLLMDLRLKFKPLNPESWRSWRWLLVVVSWSPQPGWFAHQIWIYSGTNPLIFLAALQLSHSTGGVLANQEMWALLADQPPPSTINQIFKTPTNWLSELITELLEHKQSFSKVVNSLSFILKSCKNYRQNPNPTQTWSIVRNLIFTTMINCFKADPEAFIAKNKHKHLVIFPQDGMYTLSQIEISSLGQEPLWSAKNHPCKMHQSGCTHCTRTWSRYSPGP